MDIERFSFECQKVDLKDLIRRKTKTNRNSLRACFPTLCRALHKLHVIT